MHQHIPNKIALHQWWMKVDAIFVHGYVIRACFMYVFVDYRKSPYYNICMAWLAHAIPEGKASSSAFFHNHSVYWAKGQSQMGHVAQFRNIAQVENMSSKSHDNVSQLSN